MVESCDIRAEQGDDSVAPRGSETICAQNGGVHQSVKEQGARRGGVTDLLGPLVGACRVEEWAGAVEGNMGRPGDWAQHDLFFFFHFCFLFLLISRIQI